MIHDDATSLLQLQTTCSRMQTIFRCFWYNTPQKMELFNAAVGHTPLFVSKQDQNS